MADFEKLLSKLDDLDTKMKDGLHSCATKEDLARVDADGKTVLAKMEEHQSDVQRQLQEIAVEAKRVTSAPKSINEEHRAFNEMVVKAQSEGTAAGGGNLVDDEQVQTIRSAQENYGVGRSIFDVYPMGSDVTNIPVDEFDDDDTLTVSTVAENAQITATDGEIYTLALTAVKKACLTHVSSELLQDSFANIIGGWLVNKIGRKVAKVEDTFWFDDATYGILNVTGPQTSTIGGGSFTDLTGDDVIDAEDDIVGDALAGAGLFAHRSVVNILRKLKDTGGEYLWQTLAPGAPPTVNGYPVRRVEVLPKRSATAVSTAFALFGDLNLGYVAGERGGERLDLSNDFKFDYDQTSVRFIERIAGNTNARLGKAITMLTTAAS